MGSLDIYYININYITSWKHLSIVFGMATQYQCLYPIWSIQSYNLNYSMDTFYETPLKFMGIRYNTIPLSASIKLLNSYLSEISIWKTRVTTNWAIEDVSEWTFVSRHCLTTAHHDSVFWWERLMAQCLHPKSFLFGFGRIHVVIYDWTQGLTCEKHSPGIWSKSHLCQL